MNARRLVLYGKGRNPSFVVPGDLIKDGNIIREVTPILIERNNCKDPLDEELVNRVIHLAVETGDWQFYRNMRAEHFVLSAPDGRTIVYRAPGAMLRDAFLPSARNITMGNVFQQARAWPALQAAHGRLYEGCSYDQANEVQRHVDEILKKIGPTCMDSCWVIRTDKCSPWWARWEREREKGRNFPEVLDNIDRRKRLWPISGDDVGFILGSMAAWREWNLNAPPLEFRA